ncbi:MAG: hypothetical protein BJ554DRAFT_6907 [Olpidium bornovanus]|uniref:Calnexin n=1 Tax=Olpidium bornovanus TaxID=278681 RepID=A0A8H8DJM4_9FUNG|nr:MAG: hypothetical protein BJ554DRAFT_6907 [Olpidium bornovanus]
MSGIGFELWTMQPDIMFDNIFIGHDVGEAEAFAEETWRIKHDVESAEEKKALSHNMKTAERAEHAPEVQFAQDPKGYVENKIFSIISKISGIPMEDLKARRLYILAITVTAIALMATLANKVLSSLGRAKTAGETTTDEGEEEDEEEEDAAPTRETAKKTQDGKSRTGSTALRNRSSTAAAVSVDKTADEE